MFEPGWSSAACLQEAYEQLIPVLPMCMRRLTTHPASAANQATQATQTRQQGLNQSAETSHPSSPAPRRAIA